MSQYTGADVMAAATAAGADATLARIMGAAAMAEGGGNLEAVGDNGNSHGPYQINLTVHELSVAQCCDLDFSTRFMYTNEFLRTFRDGQRWGYLDEVLARYSCMAAERPYGWNGPNDPGLDSPAADNYAAHWRDLGEAPMPTTRTYDPTVPPVRQSDPWSCSIASTAFLLHSLGITDSYSALEVAMVRDGIVSAAFGLLDGSGAALADWLTRTYGLTAYSQRDVAWDWLLRYAGSRPLALGSGSLYHWVAVRDVDGESLTLSNPAPGYKGLGDTMTAAQFAQWAPWACVSINVAEEESPEVIAELQQQLDDATNLIGNMRGDWADAVESAIQAAKIEPRRTPRNAELDAALAALQTIRNGG